MQLHSPYVRRGCCDGCEGMDLLAAKVGEGGTERIRIGGGQRREGEDGRAASRGRSGRFQTPRSAYLLKGISYTPISDSTNNDKSPKNNSLVGSPGAVTESNLCSLQKKCKAIMG